MKQTLTFIAGAALGLAIGIFGRTTSDDYRAYLIAQKRELEFKGWLIQYVDDRARYIWWESTGEWPEKKKDQQ